jgi:hypothetical protein
LRSEVKYINQLQVLETLDLQQAIIKKWTVFCQCAFYGSGYFKWRK